jgi:hypothetical protein
MRMHSGSATEVQSRDSWMGISEAGSWLRAAPLINVDAGARRQDSAGADA